MFLVSMGDARFNGLTPVSTLRCFNACGVFRFAVSKKAECHAGLVSASDSAFLFLGFNLFEVVYRAVARFCVSCFYFYGFQVV